MEPGLPEQKFEDLLDEYSSEEDVQKAINEKQAGLKEYKSESISIKEIYPKHQDELDLHNFTGEEARQKTKNYLKNSQYNKLRTVRIITGKGLHSENAKAVVRSVVLETIMALKKKALYWSMNGKVKQNKKAELLLSTLPHSKRTLKIRVWKSKK